MISMELTRIQKKYALYIILANTIEEGWESDPQAVAKIQQASKFLNDDSIVNAEPLPAIDFQKITRNQYLYLISLGYLPRDIRTAGGLNKYKFEKWAREHKVTQSYRRKINIKSIDFTEEDTRLPVQEVSE